MWYAGEMKAHTMVVPDTSMGLQVDAPTRTFLRLDAEVVAHLRPQKPLAHIRVAYCKRSDRWAYEKLAWAEVVVFLPLLAERLVDGRVVLEGQTGRWRIPVWTETWSGMPHAGTGLQAAGAVGVGYRLLVPLEAGHNAGLHT